MAATRCPTTSRRGSATNQDPTSARRESPLWTVETREASRTGRARSSWPAPPLSMTLSRVAKGLRRAGSVPPAHPTGPSRSRAEPIRLRLRSPACQVRPRIWSTPHHRRRRDRPADRPRVGQGHACRLMPPRRTRDVRSATAPRRRASPTALRLPASATALRLSARPGPTAPVDHRTPGLAALVVGPLARGAAAPPGTPGAPGRAGAPSQGWRTRSSAGPDVAWSDSAGRTLTTAQSSAADAFLDSARQAEPRITTAVRDLAELVGGELYGLDDRLKGPDSVKRKLADELSRRPAQTVAAALAMMRDAVRYTVGIPDSRYASGAQAAVDALSEGGYDPVKLTNSWGEPGGYRGINSFWRDPETGQVFELQLHTPASFEAKSAMHDALDQPIRTPTDPSDPAELVRLRARLDEVFALVPVPDGAASVRLPNGVDRQAQAASVDQPRPAGALTRS